MRASARSRRITLRAARVDRDGDARCREASVERFEVNGQTVEPVVTPAVDQVPDGEDDDRAEDGHDDALDVEPGDVGDAEDGAGDEATDDRPRRCPG